LKVPFTTRAVRQREAALKQIHDHVVSSAHLAISENEVDLSKV
jgi:hypothetical protein